MVPKRIQRLITKYLVNEVTSSEYDELGSWINNRENKKEFNDFVKTNYLIEYNLMEFNADTTKKKLQELIEGERKVLRLKRRRKYFRYAVIFAGLLVSTYFISSKIFNAPDNGNPIIVRTKVSIKPGTDKAKLTLEDGSQVSLEKGKSFQVNNAKSNGEEIVYEDKNQNTKDIAYHYLTIPRGGEFHLKLSDGTQVWLNSESQLKFPVNFVKGETRQVELVYGEAYFHVSPSSGNKGAKFIVFNRSQEVEVLGTQFNVKAYKDEDYILTTLVEGKVAVAIEGQTQKLIPSQQLSLDLKTNTSSITTVDVYSEVSWKDGIFSFKGKPLKDIMKVISRWYDIDVVFENKELESLMFRGVLGKNQDIEEILTTIKTLSVLKEYKIIGSTVTLN